MPGRLRFRTRRFDFAEARRERGALLTASPIGTALGEPLTTALGPRATRGSSGLATVLLGTGACVLLLARRASRTGDQTAQEPRSTGHEPHLA